MVIVVLYYFEVIVSVGLLRAETTPRLLITLDGFFDSCLHL